MSDPIDHERQQLLTHLLDAVKQCQVRFGGRGELATETDSRVSCLCSVWEAALQHGMRHNNKALSALKQVTELTGLAKIKGVFGEIKNMETEPVFWHYVKELLNKHELERFYMLKHINTDAGRGRAWLRAMLNEHSLERYMHMVTESPLVSQYYEDWAFLKNQERCSMLPMMAAGVNSILFAINIDNEVYNTIKPAEGIQLPAMISPTLPVSPASQDNLQPVIAGNNSHERKRDHKKKKKKLANVVSFESDENDVEKATTKLQSTVLDSRPYPATPAVDMPGASYNGNSKGMATQKYSGVATREESPFIRIHRQESRTSLASSYTSTDAEELMMNDKTPCDLTPYATDQPVVLPDDIQSVDSYDLPNYTSSALDNASFALSVTKQAGSPGYRTQGDGMTSPDTSKQDAMSTSDLKQAVVAMMLRKDEVEEENKSIRAALEQEVEMTTGLRMEIKELKDKYSKQQESSSEKVKAISRENELLKHQLKKYVNAVQLLRQEQSQGDGPPGVHLNDVQPPIPQPQSSIDYSMEASAYEQKLVQVAEMHGELIEFNEHLQQTLNGREAVIRRLRHELVELRGPLPQAGSVQGDDISIASDTTSISSGRPLINVWIPSAFLRGSGSDGYHVYQIYIRIREEEWNVYRRYAQFHDFHRKQKKKLPLLNTFDFPPKKSLGNKGTKFVEVRRRKLQIYLRHVINHVVQNNQDLLNSACKQKLLEYIPFFGDPPAGDKDGRRKSRSNSQLSSSPGAQPGTSPTQYTGL